MCVTLQGTPGTKKVLTLFFSLISDDFLMISGGSKGNIGKKRFKPTYKLIEIITKKVSDKYYYLQEQRGMLFVSRIWIFTFYLSHHY